jgi:hypothetical protein
MNVLYVKILSHNIRLVGLKIVLLAYIQKVLGLNLGWVRLVNFFLMFFHFLQANAVLDFMRATSASFWRLSSSSYYHLMLYSHDTQNFVK